MNVNLLQVKRMLTNKHATVVTVVATETADRKRHISMAVLSCESCEMKAMYSLACATHK